MLNRKDSSHANNVAKFQSAINVVMSFGSSYKPANFLSVPNLSNSEMEASSALNEVNKFHNEHKEAVNARRESFDYLKDLFPRIVKAMEAHLASEERIKDAQGLINRMNGSTKTVTVDSAEPGKGKEKKRVHTSSNTSYINKAVTLENLILILSKEPNYLPSEPALSILELKSFHAKIVALNRAVEKTNTDWQVMLNERDKILYEGKNNLSDLLRNVKNYVKSAYGKASEQYRLIKGITIRSYRHA